MREILFRGKRVDNGEWVYGSFHSPFKGNSQIIHKQGNNLSNFTDVIPETVGQFTGLTDKNGNKIFEGDKDERDRVVMWSKELYLFCLHSFNVDRWIPCVYPMRKSDNIEITGTIHD